MSTRSAVFAIPGDLSSMTGGYIYDRRLMEELRFLGRDMQHMPLGASFPDPSQADTGDAAQKLAAVSAGHPILFDGLALGAMDHDALCRVTAPIVALIHHPLALETGLMPAQRDHLYRLERANLALAAHVIVPSPHTASVLCADYGLRPDQITVARPGVDPPKYAAAPIHPPLILSVGILVFRKGHDILLRALARLTDRDWQAVIVGTAQDAACAAHLSALVQDLGLGDRVRLTGRIPGETLAEMYSQASLFALATRHEGHGLVFDEAMTLGLPIISCDVGAVSETVAPDAGRLVPPDDPEAFADALATILDDHDMRARMSAASARAGCGLPDWRETACIVDDVLSRVISGTGPSG
jgi:glycosyltransferase involved in cell wall biosynthesis